MALSKKRALESVVDILNGPRSAEMPRLQRIADAMRPARKGQYRVDVPDGAPKEMQSLARKAETNYMPLAVDTFSQSMKVEGIYSPSDKGMEKQPAWKHWQRNRMNARQTGLHRAALQYGVAYTINLPGDSGPVVKCVSPRQLTALYQDPSDDEWPMLALHIDDDLITLYDEEQTYTFGRENKPRSGLAPSCSAEYLGGRLTFIEAKEHGVGVCPVVRYRDRMLLDGEEQYGIVEPLLAIQDRITETTFGLLVAQYFAAFKQKYIIGWIPQDEHERLKASAAAIMSFKDPDVKVGQFDETDLTRYIQSKRSAVMDLAAIGQIPPQSLGADGISNISAEALAGLESAKDRKADEITTSLGESHEQTLRIQAHIAGDPGADDYESEIRWKDATARSFAQMVDGLGKLAQMLQVPVEMLWEDIPGWTDTKVDRARQMRETDPVQSLARTVFSEQG
ncbi:phage portal protein [Cumulibacter soli]|uniref:phage portal protein n=1 Tax=Cumulibacter soli TaxID=2546344 RepID=UPI001067E6CC|nr:phage portal protein [Cumulibacter soli]